MISAREIEAWRAFAPWSNDVQVEQDYLLCKAVATIFADKFLSSQVAMRGGTVLHKGHLAPAGRYSEDIDLVRVGDRPASHLKKALTRVLRPLLGEPAESIYTSITLAVRNLALKSKIIRSTYIYDPWSPEATFAKLKIEVNINETQSLYPLVPVTIEAPNGEGGATTLSVRSYDLDEMLGTKMRCFLRRSCCDRSGPSRLRSRPVQPEMTRNLAGLYPRPIVPYVASKSNPQPSTSQHRRWSALLDSTSAVSERKG